MIKRAIAILKRAIAILIWFVLFVSLAWADDVHLKWDSAEGVEGYKIQMLVVENNTDWGPTTDVGNVTETIVTDVPATGLVLFRVSAYNKNGETINTTAGAWYNATWIAPDKPIALGVE